MRRTISNAVAATALGLLAVAQAAAEPPSPQPGGAARFIERPEIGTMRASKVIGLPVIGMDHVRIGTIEDVLVDESGRARAVVIGVGGLLGIGEKHVALPFDQVAWNVGDVPLTGAPTSVVTPRNAPSAAEAAKAGPEAMPGAKTDRAVLGAVQDRHSGRVTEATGSVEPQQSDGTRATVLAGSKPIHAEVRLTQAQIKDAPSFRFEGSGR